MFAVRNIKTGKFLKAFNGSFNKASFHVQYALARNMMTKKELETDRQNRMPSIASNKAEKVKWDSIVEAMWCLDTADGAQLYKTKSAVSVSLNLRNEDWIEIVPVISIEATVFEEMKSRY